MSGRSVANARSPAPAKPWGRFLARTRSKNASDATGRKEIAQAYQKYIPLEDASAYERVAIGYGREQLLPNADGPNGHKMQRDWYAKQGLVPKLPDMNDVVDASFARALK